MDDPLDNIARIDATLTVLPEPALLQSLNWEWVAQERELMWHKGVPTPDFNCDHNIEDDPLLKEAIKQIRDEFYVLFNRLLYLHTLDWRKTSDSSFENAMLVHRPLVAKPLSQSLRQYTLESYRRLRHVNYGFSDEAKAKILQRTSHYGKRVDYAPLSETNAYEIFRKIVGRSIAAFRAATGYEPGVSLDNFTMERFSLMKDHPDENSRIREKLSEKDFSSDPRRWEENARSPADSDYPVTRGGPGSWKR